MSLPPFAAIALRGLVAAVAAKAGHDLAPEMLDAYTATALWAVGGVIAEAAIHRRRRARRNPDKRP